MSDMEPEDEVRRALHAKADALEVDDREFDPGMGSVVEIDDSPRRRSRTLWTALVAAAVVIAVIGVAVAVRSPGSSKPEGGDTPSTIPETTTTLGMLSKSQPAPAALVEQVTSLPTDVLGTAPATASPDWLRPLPGSPLLTNDGKPRIIWIGAEYCPYCAAQRWPLIIALARFGTFSGLRLTGSAIETGVGSPEVFPNTQGFSFHGATYQSDYIDFEAVEQMDNKFQPLDHPTAEQSTIFEKYDAPPYVETQSQGAIPFVYIANELFISGASYDAGILQAKTAQQIADALRDPSSPIAKNVDDVANLITDAICSTVGREQTPVCSEKPIVPLNPYQLKG